jgi:hypothetical protein
MNEPSAKQIQIARSENDNDEPWTFQSIFFGDNAVPIQVPDYQRAYSWEQKQIELFLDDLVKYQGDDKKYYFGHFIAQDIAEDIGPHWEIVDGQQRITTFVLFLMVCRVLSPSGGHASAYSMIQRFSTVSYDVAALDTIDRNLASMLEAFGDFNYKNPPSDDQIRMVLALNDNFTRSQRRIVFALLRFHQAFQKEELDPKQIGAYIKLVMEAQCSCHRTPDKSVAVNIFEMHNTRGIRLTTLEIIKARLMKFVYDHGGRDKESKVAEVQYEFGQIFAMEEHLSKNTLRGEMTMEQLLHLHLRVVDDGTKKAADQFHRPATNASADELVKYVDSRLNFMDDDKPTPKKREEGVEYALKLAKEFKKSVRIVSEHLPAWDNQDSLVGDVLILERDLSCQFFLIVCRSLGPDHANGRVGNETLTQWERLLFTRDFHGKYHGLTYRDNFPALFQSCGSDEEKIRTEIKKYVADGFRPNDHTKGLQSIVRAFLNQHKPWFLNQAYTGWKLKIIYAVYKYEKRGGAKMRKVMQDKISLEHILPQEWYALIDTDEKGNFTGMSKDKSDTFRKTIDDCINGIGNLLLLTQGENASVGKIHPAKKEYPKEYDGGTYKEHDDNPERWNSPNDWENLIQQRGKMIFEFMLREFVGPAEEPNDA